MRHTHNLGINVGVETEGSKGGVRPEEEGDGWLTFVEEDNHFVEGLTFEEKNDTILLLLLVFYNM